MIKLVFNNNNNYYSFNGDSSDRCTFILPKPLYPVKMEIFQSAEELTFLDTLSKFKSNEQLVPPKTFRFNVTDYLKQLKYCFIRIFCVKLAISCFEY